MSRNQSKRAYGSRRTGSGRNPQPAKSLAGLSSQSRQELQLAILTCPWTSAITSSSGGVINAVVPINPSNAEGWSVFSSAFDQYRVRAIQCTYRPGCSALATPTGLLGMVLDRDSAVALTSYGGAATYQSFCQGPLDRALARMYKMSNDPGEQTFKNTASPSDPGAFKFWATGVTASTAYGAVEVKYLIEFRGQGH